MPRFRGALPQLWLPLVFLPLLVGCGLAGDAANQVIDQDDLAVMVLSREDLAVDLQGFEVDPDDSGPTTAKEAADSTIDPKDTPATLRQKGWVDGYELSYSDPERAAFKDRRGLVAASSTVDLFDTETSARAYLLKELRDFERFQGRTIEGVKLDKFETFDVNVGDEGWGVVFSARVGRVSMHATGVFFRHGRVVADAGFLRADSDSMPEAALRVATALDERIKQVLAGDFQGKPVALPSPGAPRSGPDPKPLTLDGKDFQGAKLVHDGYFDQGHVFLREFDVAGTLGTSKIVYLRTLTQVFKSARAAAAHQRVLDSSKGSKAFAHAFLRLYFRSTGFTPRRVEARPLPWSGSDTVGVQFFFDAPKGRIEGVLLSVQAGRVQGSVMVMGLADNVDPADVLTTRDKLRARLGG